MRTERIRIVGALVVFLSLPVFLECQGQPASRSGDGADLGAGLDSVAADIAPSLKGDSPFLVSPDCRQLLIKTELGMGRSELRLEDLETRKVLGRYEGEYPLLIGWRPRSRWISFVEDDRKVSIYRLRFWATDSGAVIVPNAPGMPLANRFLRWSPDGRYLALPTPGGKGRDQLRLLDARTPSAESRVVYEAEGISDIDWSPDGSCLAVLAAENAGALVLVDPRDGNPIRRFMVSPKANLKQLAWLPGGRGLLVACRDPNQTSFGLRRIDLASGESALLEAPDGTVELTAEAALSDGRYLFNVNRGGLSTLMIAGPNAPARPIGFGGGSSSLLAVDERGGNLWVAHKDLARPSALYRVRLGDGREKLVLQNVTGGGFSGSAPASFTIPVSDGSRLLLHVWRAGFLPSRGVVIEFPYVRTVPMDITFDAGRQYVVRQGYDYIVFDFRPTTDGRKDWGTRITEGDVTSALAVVDYALRTLGTPPDKVVLFGRSNGTAYVALTAARMREKRGGLLLRSTVGSLQSMDKISDHRFRIVGLHGEYDPFPGSVAKAGIEHVFGPDSLSGSKGFWRLLQGEAHSPVFIRSKAVVSAALLRLLAAPPEASR